MLKKKTMFPHSKGRRGTAVGDGNRGAARRERVLRKVSQTPKFHKWLQRVPKRGRPLV